MLSFGLVEYSLQTHYCMDYDIMVVMELLITLFIRLCTLFVYLLTLEANKISIVMC